MSAPPTIAPLRPDEAAAAVALWEAAGLVRPWNDAHADVARALGRDDATILAAHASDGALAATVMAGYDGHRGWLYYLAVADARRRAGIGRAMVAAAEAWLRARGAPKVQLMVRGDNADVRAFYAALGYVADDVIVMSRRFAR